MGGRQVLDKPGHFETLCGGNIRSPTEDGGQRCGGFWIVILIGAGQGDNQATGHIVRQLVHVINLGGEQQLADIGKDRVRHRHPCGILHAVNRSSHATGKKTFRDGD